MAVRNLVYRTNGEVLRNTITPLEGGYEVEFVLSLAMVWPISTGPSRNLALRLRCRVIRP